MANPAYDAASVPEPFPLRDFTMMVEMWIVVALVIVLGIPFTLWWWKQADKWADKEHKRFKVKEDTRERVTVKKADIASGDGAPPNAS